MKLRENTILKEINGEYIIIPLSDDNLDYDVILKTNSVGAFIYKSLENEITYDELLEILIDKYDVDKSVLREDLDSFLTSLKNKGILDD